MKIQSIPVEFARKKVDKSHKCIRCNLCNYKLHIKCNKTDEKTYVKMVKGEKIQLCLKCIEGSLPLQKLTDQQFFTISAKGINKDIEDINQSILPPSSFKSFFNRVNDLSNNDNNEEDIPAINCKYVDINSFKYTQKVKDFSLFHLNIASLAKHKDELETVLNLLDYKFDILGITETKIINNFTPIFDTTMKGYKHFYTSTESEKGGALLYVNDQLNSKPRKDLDMLVYKSRQLESIFVEIINPGKKNILVGCIYRHPSMDLNEFNEEFLEPLMEKLSTENNFFF